MVIHLAKAYIVFPKGKRKMQKPKWTHKKPNHLLPQDFILISVCWATNKISHCPCHFKYILNNSNSLNNLRSMIMPTFIMKKGESKRLCVLPKAIQLANVEAISHHCIHLTSWYTYFITLSWLHTPEGQPRVQPILAPMSTVSGVLINGTYGVFSESIWLFRKKGNEILLGDDSIHFYIPSA